VQTSKKLAIGAFGLAAALSACGSSGHSAAAFHEVTVPAPPPTTTTQELSTGTGSSPGLPSVTVTTGPGYVFKVSQASIASQPTFTTDDGTGTGGTAVDAPPGSTLVVAKLTFSNDTSRPELLPFAPVQLPAEMSAGVVEMAVPVADASVFNLDESAQSAYCTTSGSAIYAPVGYCNLNAKIGAFGPAQTDITQPSQVDPGESGSLTLESDQSLSGAWISESAPVQDVRIFAQPSSSCTCWTPLS
jgi:hypothetical protein